MYYSGYDDTIHQGESYTGYSIWVRNIPRLPNAFHCILLPGHISRCLGMADSARA
jgi:hypothetical protein